MTTLDELTRRLHETGLLLESTFFDDIPIDHLTADSRQVRPDGLFVAIRGVAADGHLFIDKAVENGARAIVCEAVPENHDVRYPGIAFIHVSDSRSALADLAAAVFEDPSRSLRMIGVTGTNGKTTVTYLIHHVLTALGSRAGLIGTIEVRIGDDGLDTERTTPDPLQIQQLLRRMADAGCTICAMEVSSHALDQQRVRSIDFDVAVFTNLTRDHLDYHGTLGAYRDAKKRLFDGLGPDAAAVYNADDPAGAAMVSETRAYRASYGVDAPSDVRVALVENSIDGLLLGWRGRTRRFRLVGRFNAYNLMAAYSACRALGYNDEEVLSALEQAPPVPGRFEIIPLDDGTRVVVDYAHTPDALENVLRTLVETKADAPTLWCLFGCGGDRDREKRPMMGAVAERYADRIIVTSDNPRTEAPEDIIDDIRRGFEHPERVRVVVDRREAILAVARAARAGDIVLVAGKGHEPYQTIGTEDHPFDDREVVREVFSPRIGTRADDGAEG